MTTKELSIIYNITVEKAEMVLFDLYQKGVIDKYHNRMGMYGLANKSIRISKLLFIFLNKVADCNRFYGNFI